MKKDHEHDHLTQEAIEATEAYLRRSSIMFLECAINLMATHMTIDEVKHLLMEQIELLDEFG